MKTATCAIVGAGLAGLSAAEAIRAEGFDGRVLLFGDEPELPYERPPLSKEFLRGEVESDRVPLRAPAFYAEHRIEVHMRTRVAHVDVQRRTLEAGKELYTYDKLLLATGASPRRLPVAGSDLPGVHYLRTLHDASVLRWALNSRPRVLAVGAGFIGCEIAASARAVGCNVVLLDQILPMERALGPEVGEIYARYHRDRGVTVKSGVVVTEFRGASRLEEALLSDGTTVACDLAVVGIGVTPNVSILPSELKTGDGVETDEFCRTEVDDVFAAGDVARSRRPRLGRSIRLEHFENAELQGTAAGRAMCGKLDPYDPIPFFWSYQYDLDLQYYGVAIEWERVVLRGRPDEGSFTAFYLDSERLEAACLVNRSRDASAIKRLIGQKSLAIELLGDDSVPLRNLELTGASVRQ